MFHDLAESVSLRVHRWPNILAAWTNDKVNEDKSYLLHVFDNLGNNGTQRI